MNENDEYSEICISKAQSPFTQFWNPFHITPRDFFQNRIVMKGSIMQCFFLNISHSSFHIFTYDHIFHMSKPWSGQHRYYFLTSIIGKTIKGRKPISRSKSKKKKDFRKRNTNFYNEPKIFMETNIVMMNVKQTTNVWTPKPIIDAAYFFKRLRRKGNILTI